MDTLPRVSVHTTHPQGALQDDAATHEEQVGFRDEHAHHVFFRDRGGSGGGDGGASRNMVPIENLGDTHQKQAHSNQSTPQLCDP